MIIQDIHLATYNWDTRIYYDFDPYYINDVLNDLILLGCPTEDLLKAKNLFIFNDLNRGFTFTNGLYRSSIIIIGETSSPEEFQNTFDHEKGHLAMHISEYLGIEPFSEEFQYLTGEIGKKLFPKAKIFLCSKCKRRV